MAKIIALLGALDTKGAEYGFVKQRNILNRKVEKTLV